MRKLFISIAALACLSTPSFAQTWTPQSTDTVVITSTDGTGRRVNFYAEASASGVAPIIGSTNTWTGANTFTGTTTLPSALFSGTAPTPTGTGTPTIASGSTDTSGEVTAGASATSVVITFAVAKTNAPFCVVRSQAQITSFAYTISTTAITITQTATSGNLIDYICVQH